jgi:hypothetical protein
MNVWRKLYEAFQTKFCCISCSPLHIIYPFYLTPWFNDSNNCMYRPNTMKYYGTVFHSSVNYSNFTSRVLREAASRLESHEIPPPPPSFFWTVSFITVFTKTSHQCSVSWSNESSSHSPSTVQIQFHIILPSMPTTSKWTVLFKFSSKTPHAFPKSHLCNMSNPSKPPGIN